MSKPDPFPPQGSAQWRLLAGMLQGDKITPVTAIIDYNCFTVNSRVSELRRMGWPIQTLEVPHPNQSKFPGATLPCYQIDAHFRQWAASAPEGTHPAEYKFDSGRGKFAGRSLDEIASDDGKGKL